MAGLLLLALLTALGAQDAAPLRVTIRAGEKTHGPGEHDHPRFLERWSALLEERGAVARGALAFPDAATLAETDVLVIYAAEGGAIHGDERARLEAYLARGGGLVVLHDGVCGDDPRWLSTVIGGGWEHGRSKWLEGRIGLCFADREHPITRGVANFDLEDEIYWDLHLDPGAHVLAEAFHTPFDVTPQMWTYERDGYRAFVSLSGHRDETFEHPAFRTLLLRGIAWAAGRDADLLTDAEEIAHLRYPPGGPLAPERAHEAIALEPGFELALVAAEPLVVNPISVDWDARGRAWVACTPSYPHKAEHGGAAADYVAILHDRDGDGRADEATRFFEGLDLVTSLVLCEDGAIVAAAPWILRLVDRDKDDRAERAEVLYEGFGYADTHAVISNLRFGLDGWIYGTQGYSGAGSDDVIGHATEPRPEWSVGRSPQGGWGLGMDASRRAPADADSANPNDSAAPTPPPPTHHGRIPNGVFRFRPDGSAIEPVVSYGANTWGLDFAPDGELFFTMANGSHLRHVVLPDALPRAGRVGGAPSWVDVADHDRVLPIATDDRPPYRQIDFVGGFTAASGSLIQDGGAWPDAFRGDHFVCEPTVHLVHRDRLTRDGPTFTASRPGDAEFLAARDPWFRPVHVRSAPDGSLWVLDFYNQAAVHNDTRGPRHGPTNAAVRPDRDAEHGRIWRVQHERARAIPGPPLAELDGAALLLELGSPSSWRRDVALRLLREGRAPALDEVLPFSHVAAEPAARLRALWLCDALGASDQEIAAGLEDPDAAVRWNAARILARRGDPATRATRGPAPEALVLLAVDEDPRVLIEALLALATYAVDVELAPAYAELYASLEDDWTRSALLAVYAGAPALLCEAALDLAAARGDAAGATSAGSGDPGADGRSAELALERDADAGGPAGLAEETARRAARAGDAAGIARVLERLARGVGASQSVHSDVGTGDNSSAGVQGGTDADASAGTNAGTNAGADATANGAANPETGSGSDVDPAIDASVAVRVLRAIAREHAERALDLQPASGALARLIADPRLEVATAALPLAAAAGDAAAVGALAARLRAVALDADHALEARLDAVDALLAIPEHRADAVAAAAWFLDPYFALETQVRAIDALATALDDAGESGAAAAAALTGAFRGLSPAGRERAFHHLVQRPARLAPLLDALEQGDLGPGDLGPERAHRLVHHADEAVAARARAALARPDSAGLEARIRELLPLVDAPGDAKNGRLVFQESCASCHAFAGRGGDVGPDLSGMGAHGARELLAVILDPNREVDPAYVDYVAETVDGRLVTGVLVRETPREIALRSSSGEVVVPREELASLASTGRSPMPEGLDALGAEALRDLFAFLVAGYEDFRVLSLEDACTSTTDALYDARRDARPMRFRRTGVVDVDGVPFEILDPARAPRNAVVLKGGLVADWDSKLKPPSTVVVPVGFALERVHVLGGIAAWGFPYTRSRAPAVRWTWIYADGEREEVVLRDGDRFADWIARHEVEGSAWVDVLEPGSPGQVRHFTLDPARRDVAIDAIELSSFDNHLAPTFLALTARVAGADGAPPVPAPWSPPAGVRRVIFGGGTSHDYARWYGEEDLRALAGAAQDPASFAYEEIERRLAALLPRLDLLVLAGNQPIADRALRAAIQAFPREREAGLAILHAATWHNWPDWPEYNRELVGGGARSHEAYGGIVVTLDRPEHPVLAGVRSSFGVEDELYRFERDPKGAPIVVLATGTSLATGAAYPVVWTVERGGARILCSTLGHDGGAHASPDYRRLLENASAWLRGGGSAAVERR